MKTTKKSADRIHKKVKKGEGNIKAWVQSKITKATDYLDGVADYLDNKEEQIMSDNVYLGNPNLKKQIHQQNSLKRMLLNL